ncbi:glycosyltransferase family 4 protein [Vagococcus xieshaowenii]|uniref:Undecaprenyl/decaprenyl-phosphate alpha-N-acetylglucosaminyl 1-phosphate transferase n=2 Tax=Vagococcus xieshaowenii TaxID=2562451 RepID=A0AAJ5EDG5_9ENTE|nr:MraY family glycosyltransferase [Vagococcus xieshaowenii]QCA29620.1 undecaprenyl/decaprenyl-phosphate alpha-N-acetylglucosaminyl 1-phosphate transferase [Vagococcus xieshaowenii]TFZ39856.1 undecaprenyl/decaprenyl-phosphate alpha-N-acetylglucosaminyl 1-phosphate transferase [Vagococcus xieshaowenii]
MSFILSLILRLILTFIIAAGLTPLIRRLSFWIGAVDTPNKRRINKTTMPSAGGLAIYLAFSIAILFLFKDIFSTVYSLKLILGGGIIVLTGLVDDIKEISPRAKTLGMLLAAFYTYFILNIRMDIVNVFSFENINVGWLSLPLTILWILGFVNAINLIDGLDGLASGVSIIALTTIGFIGYIASSSGAIVVQVPIMMFILVASISGFLPYNFFPAKIYLGDTGALFLGYMIAILSLQGLKNATLVTLITPLIILGVPITDTFYAIIRRKLKKQSIAKPDSMHLHHRLLSLGFTHRGAVLMIYVLALTFSIIALLYSAASPIANVVMIVAVLVGLELFVEQIGLVGEDQRPLLNAMRYIGNRAYRQQVRKEREQKKHRNQKR